MPKRKRKGAGEVPELPRVLAGSAFQLEAEESLEKPSKRVKKKSPGKADQSLVWTDLGVPEPFVKALLELGYHTPTNIQREVLPKAIKGRCDVLGVSETGTGKTLAYGLPLLRHIYQDVLCSEIEGETDLSVSAEEVDESCVTDETAVCEEEEDEMDELSVTELEEMEDVDENGVIDLTAAVQAIEAGAAAARSPGARVGGVHSLVLTPTRELAMQVLGHLQAASKHTGIKSVAVVGGMSIQKQRRVLMQRQPHLVVATPGRLWAMLSNSESEHLQSIQQSLRCLVIDEADRMVEQGHFAEVELILSALAKSTVVEGSTKRKPRQTMVFSATLTLPRGPKVSAKETLEKLASKACVASKPKTVDVTGSNKKAETLSEAKLLCDSKEIKDVHLYHFLTCHRGRTIVFCNSIDCVHRLHGLLTLLRLQPLRLHAQMQQRQRLKMLDRFASMKNAVLVASDVAARGLDIKNVSHIIHYQVPRQPETYVHRSGRTARANREGLSVVLLSPEDMPLYRRIIKELNNNQELTDFPVKLVDLQSARKRVTAARLLDKEMHKEKMSKQKMSWFERQAKAAGITLDEDVKDFAEAESEKFSSSSHQKKLARLKADLDSTFKQ